MMIVFEGYEYIPKKNIHEMIRMMNLKLMEGI